MATLRTVRRSDFDTLWRIDQACFEPGISYSQEELAWYMTRPRTFTIVAEEKGKIIGFLVAQPHARGKGHIVTIDVVESARRSGLGSKLLRAAEERLVKLGCDTVILEASVSNAPALAFYQRHGYSILRTIPRYYKDSIDALQMSKGIGAR